MEKTLDDFWHIFNAGSIAAGFVDDQIKKSLIQKGFNPNNKEFLKKHLTKICFTYNRKEYFFIRNIYICGFDWDKLFISNGRCK